MNFQCGSVNVLLPFSQIPKILLSNFHLQSEVEDTLRRIQSHKGVVGIIVINNEGEIKYFEIIRPYLSLLTEEENVR